MRQLGFDHISGYTVDAFNQLASAPLTGIRGPSSRLRQAHAPQGCIDGGVAHGPLAGAQAGEQLQALPIGVFVSTGFAAVLHLPNECVCQCHCFPC